jgi:(p)ppGpp synthase/HD superfamily hydrolase
VNAREYAAAAHAGQLYGDGDPYTVHLAAVVAIAAEFAGPGDDLDHVESVAWLHDVLEDTDTDYSDLRDTFGEDVASSVYSLSDPEGANRRERKAKLHERLQGLNREHATARACLLVKAADRLANVRACVAAGDSRLSMYRREHPAFRLAARREGLYETLWEELDRLLAE